MSHSQPGLSPRILLVDDEPSILFTLTMLLEEEGYRVTKAENGREALDRLAEETPELIVTDHMMPDLTGIELIRTVRAQPAHEKLPILFMSAALPSDIDPRELADAYLQKPADLETMLRVIKELIEG